MTLIPQSGSLIGGASANAPLKVSFEFFPPRTEEMDKQLWQSVLRLAPLSPAFVSVTYGAGGSTRERTHAIVRRIEAETPLKAAAHLTCVAATREEVDTVARDYWNSGIRNIVALRGDPPGGQKKFTPHPGGYSNAAELVAGLKRIGDFDISVAAYPEMHPDSANPVADLENLKRKIDAGATRAITQYFFDVEKFLRFRDLVAAFQIKVPLIPGILPVTNFAQVVKFSAACGASVPPWLARLFEGLDGDAETRKLVAATVAAEQCRRLQDNGVEQFHFYTLNRADLTYAICHILGLRPQAASVAQAAAGGAR